MAVSQILYLTMQFRWRKKLYGTIFLVAVAFFIFTEKNFAAEFTEAQRLDIAFETLTRFPETAAATNARVQLAVENFLTKTRGTTRFLQVVKHFKLKNHDAELLEMTLQQPTGEEGVEAIRLILANQNPESLKRVLATDAASKLVEALGRSGKNEAVPLLLEILANEKRELSLRNDAVRSVVKIQEGAERLLKMAKGGDLSADLKETVSTELNAVRWEKISAEAAKILPQTRSNEARNWPSVVELLQKKGNAASGKKIFFSAASGCANCHQVHGEGKAIGPALSEIGDKLGKDALFEAILDPGAGISFGFEANQLELKSGEEAYGVIVSESDEELVLKDLQGIETHYKRSEIANRQQLKTSLMPTGLAETMSAQGLVDLVEFLSTLRKGK